MATGLVSLLISIWLVGHIGVISGRLVALLKGEL
jgi:hypothetical protein